jgi:hypothetical protein
VLINNSIVVLYIIGKLVYEVVVKSDAAEIDISAFSKGVYFVKVFSADAVAVAVERIVLE